MIALIRPFGTVVDVNGSTLLARATVLVELGGVGALLGVGNGREGHGQGRKNNSRFHDHRRQRKEKSDKKR